MCSKQLAVHYMFLYADHKWLYPLFVESTSPTELQEILNYVDKIESIKKLWSLLKPHLHHIHVDECVDILSPWLADHEKYVFQLLYFFKLRIS